MPGRARRPMTFPITPPGAPVLQPPTGCSHVMAARGCRSVRITHTLSFVQTSPLHCRRGDAMKPMLELHDLGQSLWLDNITRSLLRTGGLRRYINEFSITGLTSNPTIFDHAVKDRRDYADWTRSKIT